MMPSSLLFIIALFLSMPAYAFTCYLTVAKDNCWLSYNVTVTAMDIQNNKPLVTVIIPQDSLWARQKFACKPGQTLRFKAQYTPVFWEKERGRSYYAKQYWMLPGAAGEKEKAWNINVCFPRQFGEVPLPPEATSQCVCDFNNIPSIPPQ